MNGDIRPCVGVLPNIIDFKDVQGQDSAIEFVSIVAASNHNLLMSG